MKKWIVVLGLLCSWRSPAWAMTLTDIWGDVKSNSKITFLDKAEVGWGWDLRHNTNGAPMALLDLWEYRFLSVSAGWADPFKQGEEGIPAILGGVHIDELVRLIAPNSADAIMNVVPTAIQPFWKKLTISYGPGWDFDNHEVAHFVAINLRFGE